jgi:hypothetical protein
LKLAYQVSMISRLCCANDKVTRQSKIECMLSLTMNNPDRKPDVMGVAGMCLPEQFREPFVPREDVKKLSDHV